MRQERPQTCRSFLIRQTGRRATPFEGVFSLAIAKLFYLRSHHRRSTMPNTRISSNIFTPVPKLVLESQDSNFSDLIPPRINMNLALERVGIVEIHSSQLGRLETHLKFTRMNFSMTIGTNDHTLFNFFVYFNQ